MTSDDSAENDVSAAGDPEKAGETSFSANGGRPVLRIVRGVPDGVDVSLDVAVLTAVLATRGGPEPSPEPLSTWKAPARLLHIPAVPGRDTWRASALPD